MQVAVSNFIMYLATDAAHVVRWDMNADSVVDIVLSRKAEDKVSQLFVDAMGKAVLVVCSSGQVYYMMYTETKSKFVQLGKLKV